VPWLEWVLPGFVEPKIDTEKIFIQNYVKQIKTWSNRNKEKQ
jgi:hypothetical protein